MISPQLDSKRYELKFCLPLDEYETIRRAVIPHVEFDPYCRNLPGHRYTVRSTYLDSEDLDFYFEKLDGTSIRKKVALTRIQ